MSTDFIPAQSPGFAGSARAVAEAAALADRLFDRWMHDGRSSPPPAARRRVATFPAPPDDPGWRAYNRAVLRWCRRRTQRSVRLAAAFGMGPDEYWRRWHEKAARDRAARRV